MEICHKMVFFAVCRRVAVVMEGFHLCAKHWSEAHTISLHVSSSLSPSFHFKVATLTFLCFEFLYTRFLFYRFIVLFFDLTTTYFVYMKIHSNVFLALLFSTIYIFFLSSLSL